MPRIARSKFALAAIAFFIVTALGAVQAGDRNDAEDLEALHGKFQKMLPKGWSATLDLLDAERPDQPGSTPAIVIQSDTPLEVSWSVPSSPPGDQLHINREPVVIRLIAMPFVPPEKYTALRQHNQKLAEICEQFTRTEMSAIPWAHKGALPLPPSAFSPETDPEKRLVRHYAYLWMRSQPTPLPTHYEGTLSFDLRLPFGIQVRDTAKSQEYLRIQQSLAKLLTPYEPKEEAP